MTKQSLRYGWLKQPQHIPIPIITCFRTNSNNVFIFLFAKYNTDTDTRIHTCTLIPTKISMQSYPEHFRETDLADPRDR
jgi:hypothetical protein